MPASGGYGGIDLSVGSLLALCGLVVASLDQESANLSGGDQQKVVLGRWLGARCRVLLFDEPSREIDVATKSKIYELIGELVEQGAVMHEGTLQGILERGEASQERIMQLALGPGSFAHAANHCSL